jgi:hypothetical protein
MRDPDLRDPNDDPVAGRSLWQRARHAPASCWARLDRLSRWLRPGLESGDPSGGDPIDADFDSLVRAAFPAPAASAVLHERVDEICSRGAAEAPHANSPAMWKRRIWMHTVRWGWIGAAVVLLAIWATTQRSNDVLAATIRATEAATALHAIDQRSDGNKEIGNTEIWFVMRVGSYMRQKTPSQNIETVLVDDLKHEYRWTVSDPDEAWRNRVEVRPSKLADQKDAAQTRELLTGTMILKAIQAEVGPKGVTTKMVVRDGRRLRQLTDPKNQQQIYVDPQTDRIVMQERSLPEGGIEQMRIDYPASIDLSRFRFEIPKGACVVDRTGEPVRRLGGGEEDACVAQMKQTAQALRHFVGENNGQWPDPDALLPATEKYQGEEPLQCPLDIRAERTYVSYIYHRPSGPVAEMALKVLEGIYAVQGREPPSILAQTVLLECRHHPGRVLRLYADGHVGREGAR